MITKIGKRYRHYKNGHTYTILALARHSETLEELVVYRADYESKDFGYGAVWVRPRAMFEETISYEGRISPRFIPLEE